MNQGSGVVMYPHLNLAVKFGPATSLRFDEAQSMRVVRQTFPQAEVPVPEVFGWRRHGYQNFIYMSIVRGQTLRAAWPSLTKTDKENVCTKLRQIVSSLQKATHDNPSLIIGSVCGGVVQDRFFQPDFIKGPFTTIESFHDWLFAAATRQSAAWEGVEKLDRDFLPDEGNVCLTHGDLTLGNIIVSDASGSWQIEGIIDWEQAGWYPEYWEYYKMSYGVEYTHEWRADGWLDRVTVPFEDEFQDEIFALDHYFQWRCP